MPKIEIVERGTFSRDASLRAELMELISPSYENPTNLLARELDHCSRLYTVRDASGELVCFYMTAQEELALPDGKKVDGLYMGLSATREDTKNSGYVSALYERSLEEAMAWEAQTGASLLLWATTASPLPYLAATSYLRAGEPNRDGSYSQEGLAMAKALRARFYPHCLASTHPFVLKGAAQNTRYSLEEQQRVARSCTTRGFTLFEELGIDERKGDRLLFIARTPQTPQPQKPPGGIRP